MKDDVTYDVSGGADVACADWLLMCHTYLCKKLH
jgi:hypothetical protein